MGALPGGTRPQSAAAALPAQSPAEATAPKRAPSAASLIHDAATPQSAPPLKLERLQDKPRVPAEVSAGYEALRSGNLEAAGRDYSAAIAKDPGNLDAQLGLATVAARAGKRSLAALHYRQALEIDPRNGTALAGMAALAQDARPEAVEAQLRTELAKSPDSAALHGALGDLYAARARWSEAQAEFFEAHRLDPGNADITYNLAVSLDHLGQARAAADFYRRALEAANEQSAQFDPAAAARRLSELR
jgi:Tfp pilus assembly protein PilF